MPTQVTIQQLGDPLEPSVRWQIGGSLGAGESAQVWRVIADNGAQYALKCARPGFERYLLDEAKALGVLDGVGAPRLEQIVLVLREDTSRSIGLVLEHVAGDTPLHAATLSPATTLDVFIDVASTLLDVHAFGFAHGDVKPEHVVVRSSGRAVLLDWGLVQPTTNNLPLGGTPAYLPPEVLQGRTCPAPRADAYALGWVALEMCGVARAGADGDDPSASQTDERIALFRSLVRSDPSDRSSLSFVLSRARYLRSRYERSDTHRREEELQDRRRAVRRAYISTRWAEIESACQRVAVPTIAVAGLPGKWLREAAGVCQAIRQAQLRTVQGDGGTLGSLGSLGSLSQHRADSVSIVASQSTDSVGSPRAVLGSLNAHDRGRFYGRLVGPAGCHFSISPVEDDAVLVERLMMWAEQAPFEALTAGRFLTLDGRDAKDPSAWAERGTLQWALALAERPVAPDLLFFLEGTDALPSLLRLTCARALRLQGAYERALAVLGTELPAEHALEAAVIHLRSGRPDVALALANDLADSVDESVRGRALAVLARLDLDRGELEVARKRLTDAPLVAAVCEVRGLLHLAAGELPRAMDAANLGRALAVNDEQAARLESVLGMVQHQGAVALVALGHFRRAVELAQAAGAVLEEATYLTGVAAAASDAGLLDESLHAAERAERLFESLGRPHDTARAMLARVSVLAALGAEVEMEAVAHRGNQLALVHGDDRCAGYLQLCLADGFSEQSRRIEAAGSALELLRDATAEDALRAWARVLECRGLPGVSDEPGGCEPTVERGDELARRVESFEARVDWWKARAIRALSARDERASVQILAELAALGLQGRQSLILGPALVAGADLALELGRNDEARALLATASSLAGKFVEGLSDEHRHLAKEKSWVRRARSLAAPVYPGEQLANVDGLLRSLSQREGLKSLFRQILDALLLWTGVERGLLLLKAPGDRLVVRAARNLRQDDLAGEQMLLSQSLARRAVAEGRPIVTVDATQDLSDSHRSVHALNLRSVLALPLLGRGEVLGVVYLDDRVRRGAFGPRELSWAQLIGSIAALTIQDERDRVLLRRAARKARRAEARAGELLLLRELELQVAERELRQVRDGNSLRGNYSGIVGQSPPMRRLLEMVDKVALSDVPVLISGESGSGKELVARALAENGSRKNRPFIAENCAAVPESLLESTLFGHVRGAFTGAAKPRAGLFEIADGGTLLLDEIGEMSLGMQAKLLRVLQSGEVRPVGSERTLKVDVRVVAATHRDLEELVRRGLFREDLWYRLNVIQLVVPPLRERPDDILPLADHFLRLHGTDAKRRFSPAVRQRLRAYAWPGNVRQLQNEVRRLVVLADEEIILADLSHELKAVADLPTGLGLKAQVDALERRLVVEALEVSRGNRTRAAEALGVSRFGLQKMMLRLEIPAGPQR